MSSDEEEASERVDELFKQCLQRYRESYPDSSIDFTKMNLTLRVKRRPNPVGQGHYSNVYKGKLDGQKPIAVKLLRLPSYSREREHLYETILLRFFREFNYWAALAHTHVASLLGFTLADGNIGFVADWCSNGNVVEYLEKHADASRHNLILDVAEGLQYLHGCTFALIHGDLKGVNILVNIHGIACIGDFGISKQINDLNRKTGFTTTSGVAGTTPWMAPELFINPAVTFQSDIYAFGGVILEILCPGKIPYGYKSSEHLIMLAKIQGELPIRDEYPELEGQDWLWDAVIACLGFKPEDRPSVAWVVETMYREFGLVPRAVGSTAYRKNRQELALERKALDTVSGMITSPPIAETPTKETPGIGGTMSHLDISMSRASRPPVTPSDAELKHAIRTFLQDADLAVVTKRIVRDQLEKQFGCELKSRRAVINSGIDQCLMDMV